MAEFDNERGNKANFGIDSSKLNGALNVEVNFEGLGPYMLLDVNIDFLFDFVATKVKVAIKS